MFLNPSFTVKRNSPGQGEAVRVIVQVVSVRGTAGTIVICLIKKSFKKLRDTMRN